MSIHLRVPLPNCQQVSCSDEIRTGPAHVSRTRSNQNKHSHAATPSEPNFWTHLECPKDHFGSCQGHQSVAKLGRACLSFLHAALLSVREGAKMRPSRTACWAAACLGTGFGPNPIHIVYRNLKTSCLVATAYHLAISWIKANFLTSCSMSCCTTNCPFTGLCRMAWLPWRNSGWNSSPGMDT